MGLLKRHMSTVIVAMITAAVTAGVPAIAHGVRHALFAHNADKVDGKHAVASSASTAARKGKLVATSPATGFLPNNIITLAPDAAKLDGRAAADFDDADTLQGKELTAWDAKRIVDQHGSPNLPIPFTSNGGTLILFTSGSGFRPDSAMGVGRIGVNIFIDPEGAGGPPPELVARIQVFADAKSSHRAFVPEYAVFEGLAAGNHAILAQTVNDAQCGTGSETSTHYCTATNDDDVFHVAMMEIPD